MKWSMLFVTIVQQDEHEDDANFIQPECEK